MLSKILLQESLKFNTLGLAVHPIGFGGKNPLVDDWSNPPKLSDSDLQLCFEKRGDIITGIGFVSGQMSNNLVVLDFDTGWQESLEHFLHAWPELNNTAMYSTAHDRRQIILRIPDLSPEFTRAVFQRSEAIIDLRANGHNNVLPPSFHAKCNKPYCAGDAYYEWLTDVEFCEVDFNELFTWLNEWGEVVTDSPKKSMPEQTVAIGDIDRMIAAGESARAITTAKRMIQQAGEGHKNSTLLRAANLLGGYVAVGVMDRDSAFDVLEAEIARKPNVNSMDQARKTIDNGLDWGAKRPFTANKILTSKIEYAQTNGHHAPLPFLINVPELSSAAESEQSSAEYKPVFKPWHWPEFLSRPPKTWLVQDNIGRGDIVILAGDSGSGKTVVTLDLSMSAITGKRYAGRFDVAHPLKIAYCTAEGIGNLPARIKAMAAHHQIPQSVLESQFFGYDGPIVPQFFLTTDSEYSIEQFERDLAALSINPDVLIIDTLALGAMGADLENNSDATAILIRAKQFTNRTGIALLFTHHNNRGGVFRGAASLRDHADGMFIARYDKERDERMLLCRDDKWGKLKDGEEWTGLRYALETHSDEAAPVVEWLGDYVPANGEAKKDASADVLALFKTPVTELEFDNIQAAIGDFYSTGSIKNTLTKLVREEKLLRSYTEPDKPPSRHNKPRYKKSVLGVLSYLSTIKLP